MKSMPLNLVLGLATVVASASSALAIDYSFPNTPYAVFNCYMGHPGTTCHTGSNHGQTLNDRPVQANVTAQLISAGSDSYGNTKATVRVTINRITDPTNFYNDLGNMPVDIVAYVCSYHRYCNWSAQTAHVVMNRTYGQRFFENSAYVDFNITGNGGAEQTESIPTIDIKLPNQQYPIAVSLTY